MENPIQSLSEEKSVMKAFSILCRRKNTFGCTFLQIPSLTMSWNIGVELSEQKMHRIMFCNNSNICHNKTPISSKIWADKGILTMNDIVENANRDSFPDLKAKFQFDEEDFLKYHKAKNSIPAL